MSADSLSVRVFMLFDYQESAELPIRLCISLQASISAAQSFLTRV